MKKISVLAILFCLALPLSAQSLGYGLGYYAETVVDAPQATNGGVELSFAYEPYLWKFCNPSLVLSTAFGKNLDQEFLVPYVNVAVSVDLFRTLSHPFGFVAHNPIAWDPSVAIGYQWENNNDEHLLVLSASPFKLTQKDFWFEFLSPFATVSLSDQEVRTWGFNLIRYTYFFR
ncbi:hypothetical protein [uncultured Sphaerochaeta sp.]|uniref:hypothetical protein n=1 Tax=uncultured Sphaerochaeta sp. TaxID=886478 RepID=UPI002A0A0F3C|nr:hypothetical protein [uncultured Sphaerochaeta sp.]